MAEFGSRGAATGSTRGGGLPSSPGPVQGQVAFKAGDGEGGGDDGGGGRSYVDSAGGGVSNGDCALVGEETGSAQPGSKRGCSTMQQRESKSGIPRRSSIIKVRGLAPPHRGDFFLPGREEMGRGLSGSHSPVSAERMCWIWRG